MSNGVTVDLEELLRLRFSANTLRLFSQHKTHSPHAGTKRASHLGRGMDFAEVRPYQAGDDIRHINWRLTARAGKPYSKLYQEERERPVYIVVDQSQSMRFGTRCQFKSVLAAKVASIFAWAALHHHDQVGGIVFNDDTFHWVTPKRQRKTLLQFLNTLVDFTQRGITPSINTTFKDALQYLQRNMISGSMVIVISDFMQLDSDIENALSMMSRYNTVLSVLTYDVLERQAPQNNMFQFTDGEQNLEFDGCAKECVVTYQSIFAKRVQQLKNVQKRSKMRVLTLASDRDLITELNKVHL